MKQIYFFAINTHYFRSSISGAIAFLFITEKTKNIDNNCAKLMNMNIIINDDIILSGYIGMLYMYVSSI